jgi:dTDP-4-dehydrorhamnose reductase
MKRVYIAGAGGMLGSDVCKVFSSTYAVKASDIDLNEDWLSFGDVRDRESMEKDIKDFSPHLIINLAALTDLEYCEAHPKNALATNYGGAKNLGLIAKLWNIPYIYISTAGIFGGEKDSYTEYDTPNPASQYAKTKYAGERFVLSKVPRSYVFRAGWMMGGKEKDKKFVGKILRQIRVGCTELFAVSDKQGTPTYTLDFARGMLNAVEEKVPHGLYNMVCEGNVSRLDVAEEIVRLLKVHLPVTEVTSDYFSEDYSAPRPRCEALVNHKLTYLNQNQMRGWKECLEEYLRE